jgi:hypothetical protein
MHLRAALATHQEVGRGQAVVEGAGSKVVVSGDHDGLGSGRASMDARWTASCPWRAWGSLRSLARWRRVEVALTRRGRRIGPSRSVRAVSWCRVVLVTVGRGGGPWRGRPCLGV